MARGAIVLILFAFCVCLSCLSSSAVGSGVFYACSDGTMTPGEFDFKKCLNFDLNDILSGTGAVTGIDTGVDEDEDEDEDASKTQGTGATDLLVPKGAEEDADAEFLDFFDKADTENLSGKGVMVSGSKTQVECAKICYNEEVEMTSADDTCNGFVSDGFSRCILFPSNSRVTGSELSGKRKSYILKEGRDGNKIIVYNAQKFASAEFFNGRPGTVGFPVSKAKKRFHDCSNNNINGMLSGFRLDNLGKPTAANATKYKYRYNCLMNPNITRGSRRSSSWVGAWDTSTCGGDGKSWSGGKSTRAANWRFLGQLPMDCGDKFISKWYMQTNGTDQESGKDLGNYDMKVTYTCTNEETSDSSLCVDKSTVDVGGERCTISEFQKQKVQCPTGMAITNLEMGNGSTKYRCCPRPNFSKDGTVIDQGSSGGL